MLPQYLPVSFQIEIIPNRANKPAILLHEAWREGQHICNKDPRQPLPLCPEVVDRFRTVVRGGLAAQDPSNLLCVERSWAHGHVAAPLSTCGRLGLKRILHSRRNRERSVKAVECHAEAIGADVTARHAAVHQQAALLQFPSPAGAPVRALYIERAGTGIPVMAAAAASTARSCGRVR